ncbi:Alpha/Beta hydrolase protein [Schizothecium vesticola]|uniref:Alpha/Beta hydrolase protein n=1 Tax=Schizothecium vesticola TaxID=314040 RepID=A0AA40KA64_9PEZI|nr:Alpha/Beta hydrolase protein [Schizothecium vesticola]
MAWLRKALRHGPVVTSGQAAISTSALMPVSNLASTEASSAASAAVAELSHSLDFVLDQFGDEEEPGDQLQYHIDRLSEEAEKYTVSSLDNIQGEEWPCSPGMGELIKAVCQCAVMVYDQTQVIGPKGFDIEPVLHRTPSTLGTVKASSMWKLPFVPIPGWNGKTLVVSVGGTSTIADHMVNMNDKPKDAACLFNFSERGQDLKVEAHSGFLACAQAITSSIAQDIDEQLAADDSISNIIFTGHSAGGAVASLIFLHFALQENASPQIVRSKLSLITFGSAPTTTLPIRIPDLRHSRPNIGPTLAILNEYDMIPRADRAYIRSIVDLYRTSHGLAPLHTPPPEADAESKARLAWPLPPPQYNLVGDIIVLRLRLSGGGSSAPVDDALSQTSMLTAPIVEAVRVAPGEFGRLLFCDLATHRRRTYLERMDIWAGQVRGCEALSPVSGTLPDWAAGFYGGGKGEW